MPHSASSDTARLVAAFRTHLWNEDIARLARRLRYFAQGAEFVVLADESKGKLAAENFVKLAHDSDMSALGLPAHPARDVLWYNGDYPLYHLRRVFPDASHYAMVEYDVAVNLDIMPMLRQAQAQALDLIAADIRAATPAWSWYDTVEKHYRAPLRAFIPFLVVSARAVDMMLGERRRIAAAHAVCATSPRTDWPFCEGFIPSAVARLEAAALRPLSDFAALPVFTFRPEQHIDDPAMNEPGTLCHPVVGSAQFARRRLKDAAYEQVMDAQSGLRRQLSFCDPALFAERLFDVVKKERDVAKIQAFMALAEAQRWTLRSPSENLAFFKPALMSSAWDAGPAPDLAQLAGGGNNGVINGGFGFHTALETGAWWQVDLQGRFLVTHILLFNRLDLPERCRKILVSGSLDGSSWQNIIAKTDDTLFGGADGKPLVFQMPVAVELRFIRLTNLEHNYFHLDEVQVLGTAA